MLPASVPTRTIVLLDFTVSPYSQTLIVKLSVVVDLILKVFQASRVWCPFVSLSGLIAFAAVEGTTAQ